MRNKIEQVLTLSQAYKDELGFISRKHVIKNFSNKNMLENYLNFYRNIVL